MNKWTTCRQACFWVEVSRVSSCASPEEDPAWQLQRGPKRPFPMRLDGASRSLG